MTTTSPYLRMALNNAWANATFYAAVTALPDGAFAAPSPGFFDSLKETLNHIHQVDLFYIDALEIGGAGRSVFFEDELDDPRQLSAAQAEADMRLARFCKTLTPAILQETRVTERRDSAPFERVDALLMHLFQHQLHHRGQAHVQLKALGVAPPQLDEFHLDFERAPTAQAYFS